MTWWEGVEYALSSAALSSAATTVLTTSTMEERARFTARNEWFMDVDETG